jgi:hypothetical protein
VTAATMQGDRPPSRVWHSWRCVKRGPLLETVKTDAIGRAHVCQMCAECGGTDLVDRLREREAAP